MHRSRCLRRLLLVNRFLSIFFSRIGLSVFTFIVSAFFVTAAPGIAETSGKSPLTLTAPYAIAMLESQGFGFAKLAFGIDGGSNTESLKSNPDYELLRKTLDADFTELYSSDPKYGIGMSFVHRGFDPSWLSSRLTQFRLGAISNRIDRKVFHPGTCGELRFIYRLGYTMAVQDGVVSSSLPMTVNVVFFLREKENNCRTVATTLESAFQETTKFPALLPMLGPENLKSVEVNVQSVRWPSTIRPDLGGHAEYILRVFERKNGKLSPARLENTPDLRRLGKDEVLTKKLIEWIRLPSNLAAIDEGTVVIPDEFLAERAVSVTPRGLSRAQNRPFTKLLRSKLPDNIPLSEYQSIGSKNALLRRLDGLSCMGCHQSRSMAGFHALGEERDPARRIDALATPLSPHAAEDLPRREQYVAALLANEIPPDRREPPDHELSSGGFGQSCGLGDAGFKNWKCAPGFHCEKDEEEVGTCMPDQPEVGAVCRVSDVNFEADEAGAETPRPCPSNFLCEGVPVGFPGGMCSGPCEAQEKNGSCGAIAILSSFNACLGSGGLFEDCAKFSRPAMLRACGGENPCRADYVCAKTPEAGPACLPPYFLLQMRVDGHPLTKVPLRNRVTNRLRSLF